MHTLFYVWHLGPYIFFIQWNLYGHLSGAWRKQTRLNAKEPTCIVINHCWLSIKQYRHVVISQKLTNKLQNLTHKYSSKAFLSTRIQKVKVIAKSKSRVGLGRQFCLSWCWETSQNNTLIGLNASVVLYSQWTEWQRHNKQGMVLSSVSAMS